MWHIPSRNHVQGETSLAHSVIVDLYVAPLYVDCVLIVTVPKWYHFLRCFFIEGGDTAGQRRVTESVYVPLTPVPNAGIIYPSWPANLKENLS